MNHALPNDAGRVEIRCDDCARDLGPAAPTLVVCVGVVGRWSLIDLGQRRPTRAARTPPPPLDPPPPPGVVTVRSWHGGRTFDQYPHRGRAVSLACRRCKRSGWRRRRLLYEVAEAARVAGTSDAYLSLA